MWSVCIRFLGFRLRVRRLLFTVFTVACSMSDSKRAAKRVKLSESAKHVLLVESVCFAVLQFLSTRELRRTARVSKHMQLVRLVLQLIAEFRLIRWFCGNPRLYMKIEVPFITSMADPDAVLRSLWKCADKRCQIIRFANPIGLAGIFAVSNFIDLLPLESTRQLHIELAYPFTLNASLPKTLAHRCSAQQAFTF